MRLAWRNPWFPAEFLRIAMTITFPSTIQIQIALFEYNSHFLNTIHIFFGYDSCFLNTIHAQNATLIPFQIKRRVHDFQLNETEYDLAMIQTSV